MEQRTALYLTLWRWHFYAALYVLPFIIVLSLTGAIYLFKPQIDRFEERAFQNLSAENPVSPNAQLDAALAAFPGARFHSYRLPQYPGDAAMIHLALADGTTMRDVFVSPGGKVLGDIDPEARTATLVSRIHGELLMGRVGSWLVELAACWAIVMIMTGLFLWWPRGRGGAGVIWPRLTLGKRAFWRDLHAVTGFWVSGFALVLLVSGLPWASVWGGAFAAVRTELGWADGARSWSIGQAGQHEDHDHDAMMKVQRAEASFASLSAIVEKARLESLAFPVLVKPPGAPEARGAPHPATWLVKSEAQNRTLIRTIEYDMTTGREISRHGFAEKHPIDRVINYGIAWHEGALFGWLNQAIGLFTAIGLMTLALSGIVMWRRRMPEGLGAPSRSRAPVQSIVPLVMLMGLAVVLPLLALSLLAFFAFDRMIVTRMPRLARWLGVERSPANV